MRNLFTLLTILVVLATLMSSCSSKTMVGKVTMQGYLNPFQANIDEGCIALTDMTVKKLTYKNGKCEIELQDPKDTGEVDNEDN